MNNSVTTLRFWQRQFALKGTQKQFAFDVSMGIFAPILCLRFDPIVFNELLSSSQVFAYTIIGLEITTLAFWLIFGTYLKQFSGFIGGILLSGAFFSVVIGVFLLPLSILGLVLVVGILGFTPFLTSFVFLRNGVRALKQANEKISMTSLVMGMGLVIFVQGGVQWAKVISELSNPLVPSEDLSTQQVTQKLQYLCADNNLNSNNYNKLLNKIVLIYAEETEPSRQKVIAELYHNMTGEHIQRRLWILSD